jgi:hypothetical protein
MLLLMWMLAVTGLADEPLTKTLATSAANVQRVRVDVEVGRAVISNGTDDTIRVEVRLESRDAKRLTTCAQSTIESHLNGSELVIRLEQPGRDHCTTRWTVQLPRNMALDASVGVGDLEATLAGRYGEISVRSNVGSVDLRVDGLRVASRRPPGPSDEARMSGGEGPALRLRSNVGGVKASISRTDASRVAPSR